MLWLVTRRQINGAAMLEISASQKSLPTTFLTKTLMRITSLQSFMTKCGCDIFIQIREDTKKEEKNQKNQRRMEQTLPMGTIVHCTRLSGTLSQLSTYILALVLINSGYSIIHDLGRERKLFSLFYFQNARQPDLLPGRGQFAVSDSIYWKVAKTSTDKKSYWKEPKTDENVKTFRLPLPPVGKKASLVINFDSISRECIRPGKATANM